MSKNSIKRTYKYRLYPTKEQESFLSQHFGAVRWAYNTFLEARRDRYQQSKENYTYNQQSKALTEMKKEAETQWLKDINAQSLQQSLKHLDGAFNSFFKGLARFPKFKSKKGKNSFKIPQNFCLENGRFYIPKLKTGIKIVEHRGMKGVSSQCTVSKTPSGKYFVSILTEEEYIPYKKTGKEVGVDLGIKDFCVSSDGVRFKKHKFTKKYEKKLAKAQKHLARKLKGSNRKNKQRNKVALIHEKIVNSRNDKLHKISNSLVKENDVIYLEDLNVKGMIKNRRLSKAISDCAWGNFVRMLEYKAKWNNRELVFVDRFYPSSKTCNSCGFMNQNLKLKDRNWICYSCGCQVDRDLNASKNILAEGKRISLGTSDYTRGARIRPTMLATGDKASSSRLKSWVVHQQAVMSKEFKGE